MEPAIDRDRLFDLLEDQPTLFDAVYQELAAEVPRQLTHIRAALAGRHDGALATAAHRLRGAVASFYAIPCATAAETLEEMGRSNDFAGTPEALARLEEELDRLWTELRLVRQELLP